MHAGLEERPPPAHAPADLAEGERDDGSICFQLFTNDFSIEPSSVTYCPPPRRQFAELLSLGLDTDQSDAGSVGMFS
eukprot:876458-Pyramimonas_sp.AAC.1